MIDYKKYLKNENNVFFQIGAHDGIIGEEYGLQDFMTKNNVFYFVEPVPQFMDSLKENYKNYDCHKEYIKCAIRNFEGEDFINLLGGSTTFHASGNGAVLVEIKRMSRILSEYNIKNIDMLLIDAEMCEAERITDLDFDSIVPKIIRYEYHLLSEKQKEAISNKLQNLYVIDDCLYDSRHNKVCILKEYYKG